MLHAFIRFGDGRISTDTEPANLTAALRDPKARFWLDMDQPTDDELCLLDEVFGFHPLTIEDCIGFTERPKIESYNHIGDACQQGYFFMVFHAPDLAAFKEELRTREIDMFVSERYLITLHENTIGSIAELRKRAMSDPRIVLDPGIDLLLHNILDKMVDAYQPILDHLQEELSDLEELAITSPTPDLLTRISVKKRELLNLRRIMAPQRDVLATLTRGEVPFIRESTRIYLRDVQDHLIRAVEMVELYRDLVIGVRDIYLSSVSNNLSQIMKTLTVISVVALPLTVITSFFGMNFDAIPGLHSPEGFWLTVLFMGCVVTGLLVLFIRKRWI